MPTIDLNIQDFISRFNIIKSELLRIQQADMPEFDRLLQHISDVSKIVHQRISDINREALNRIITHNGLKPAQRTQLVDQVLTAYE